MDLSGYSDDDLDRLINERVSKKRPQDLSDDELDFMIDRQQKSSAAPQFESPAPIGPPAQKVLTGGVTQNDWFEDMRKANQQEKSLGWGERAIAKGDAWEDGLLDIADVMPTLTKAGLDQLPGPARGIAKDLIPYAGFMSTAKDFIDWEKGNIKNRTADVRAKAPQFYNQYKSMVTNLAPLGLDLAAPMASSLGLQSLIPRVGEQMAVGAGASGLPDAAEQYNQTGHIDPLRTAAVTGGGALLGGATGLGALGLEKLVQRAAQMLKNRRSAPGQSIGQGDLASMLDPTLQLDAAERQALDFREGMDAPLDAQPTQPAMPANPLEALMNDIQSQIDRYKSQRSTNPPVEEAGLPPEVLAEFRYNTELGGRNRLADATMVSDLPIGLTPQEQELLNAMLKAKSQRDYDAARLKAYELAYMQQFAPGQKEFVHKGVKTSLNMDEPNWSRAQEDEIYQMKHALANGVKEDLATPDYIRGLGDADYGQARGDYPVEPPPVPADLDEATSQLLDLKFQLDGAKTTKNQRLLGALDIEGSDKAYDRMRKDNRQLILDLQERLRKEQNDPLARLFVKGEFPHPEGIKRGNVQYGLEIQQGQRQLDMTGKEDEFENFVKNYKNDKIPVDSDTWFKFLSEADQELRDKGQMAPWPEVQKRALQLAKQEGFAMERVPYKTNVGLDQRKADGALKYQTLMNYARKGAASAIFLAWLSDQEAQAADGTEGTKKSQHLPSWLGVAAGTTALGGAGTAAMLRKNPRMLQQAFQHVTRIPVLWRDTMDNIKVLDKALQNARTQAAAAAKDPRNFKMLSPEQQAMIKPPTHTGSIEEDIWRHMAAGNQTTWGVKFDNPEQRASALHALKIGHVNAKQAMDPAKNPMPDPNQYNPFKDLSPAQRAAIVRQHVIQKSLQSKINAYSAEISALTASGALKVEGQVIDAKDAFDFVKKQLSPDKPAANIFSNALGKMTDNVMDALFFWNPEHHITNISDQFIAGGSRVGLHNIAQANMILGPGGDKELKAIFENSNLVGSYRADRMESVASGPVKAPSKWQVVKNTDLPSDRINADRVALGALLEHFGTRDTQRVKDFFGGKLTPDETAAAWMHMTERLSRTLGVDDMRLNTDVLSRTPGFNKLMSFFRQPARLNRLMIDNLATGNYSGVFQAMGMTALLGGRAALPRDVGALMQLNPDAAQVYFNAAAALDQYGNLYEKATGQNNASKLEYGLLPGAAMGMSAGNMAMEMSGQTRQQVAEAVEEFGKIQKTLEKKDFSQLSDKEIADLSKPYYKLFKTASMLAMPRMPVTNIPMRSSFKVADAMDAVSTDQKRINYFEQDATRPYHKADVIKPSDFPGYASQILLDPILPGVPRVEDQYKQARLEVSKIKAPKGKRAYTIPQRGNNGGGASGRGAN